MKKSDEKVETKETKAPEGEVITKDLSIYEKLQKVQLELKAPKSQWNDYSSYYYRSCEDILEGLKPLMEKYKLLITVSDSIEQVCERFYVVATAKLVNLEDVSEVIEIKANAREPENKKGMDPAQVTGATSSYARKYALNGMFAIDDSKDADYHDNNSKGQETPSQRGKSGLELSEKQISRLYAIGYSKGLSRQDIINQVGTRYKKKVEELTKNEYDQVCNGYEEMEAKK